MAIALGGLFSCLAGCYLTRGKNPSLPVTAADSRQRIAILEQHPKRLERPVVVVSGFNDLGIPGLYLGPKLRKATGDTRVIAVPMQGCHDFETCAKRLIETVESNFPSDAANETIEIDVVAVSMGGLVSRFAALPRKEGRRLRIHRLFTISSPHRGADLAGLPAFEEVQTDMRPGSDFLQKLDSFPRDYPIFPYVRLGDVIVGAKNAAPAGEVAWWLPPEDVSPTHGFAHTDDRIFLDIALRLRNEAPVSSEPRNP